MSYTKIGDICGNTINQNLGISVSINTNGVYIASGLPNGGDAGRAIVYEWQDDPSGYIKRDIILNINTQKFGSQVSLSSDGNIIAISDIWWSLDTSSNLGKVVVYKWNSSFSTYLVKGSDNIYGDLANDEFGNALKLSSDGSTFIASTSGNADTTYVKVYSFDGSNYSQKGLTLGSGSITGNPNAISINSNGNIIAYFDLIDFAVRILNWNGSVWSTYDDISGNASAISLNSDGSIIAIGSAGDGTGGTVSVYKRNNISGVYELRGSVLDPANFGDNFGFSVSISANGDKLIVGAPNTNSENGSIYIYNWNSGTSEYELVIPSISSDVSGQLGYDVGISSNGLITIAGAPFQEGQLGEPGSGYAAIYSLNGDFPCLYKDTLVLTPNGYVCVTDLKIGDYVITSDNRKSRIKNIYKNIVEGNNKTCPYIIKANSIDNNYPPIDTRISRGHLIKFNDNWIHPKKNAHIFDQDLSLKSVEYYHIHLENYITDHLVVNNGLIVESYIGSKMYTKNVNEYNKRLKESIILQNKKT